MSQGIFDLFSDRLADSEIQDAWEVAGFGRAALASPALYPGIGFNFLNSAT